MKHPKLHCAGMLTVAAVWLALAGWAWFGPAKSHSVAERRPLAQFPELSAQQLTSGKFMSDFDKYSLDQFPMRDSFRTLKALVNYKVLMQRDNNGIYLSDGHIAKLEYPLNQASVQRALGVFDKISSKYLKDSAVYMAVIPDKGYYLTQENRYPAMDYQQLFTLVRAGAPYAKHIDLTGALTADDYYRTDTHWRQENLFTATDALCQAMKIESPKAQNYTATPLERPFYGVYYGQAAMPVAADTLYTLHSALLEQCRVYNYETGAYTGIYDLGKLTSDDLYEVFLSGSVSLLTIENPAAQTDRELIVFRDSFGSSIAPLLVQGYKSVTLVDIRYISSAMLSRFIDFHGQDVLFLYSTIVLNNSNQIS